MNLPAKLNFFLTILVIVGFFVLTAFTISLNEKIGSLPSESQAPLQIADTSNYVTKPDLDKLKDQLEAKIATSTPSSTTTTVIKEVPASPQPASDKNDTDYITLGSTYSTTSTTWLDVPDAQVYVDLANDYVSDAYVTWEASLKVAHGNGKAFARLYDSTHNIAVDGSEISTENNADFLYVKSGSLPFWRGNNLYKVQIKSLQGFEVFISNAKIKITY